MCEVIAEGRDVGCPITTAVFLPPIDNCGDQICNDGYLEVVSAMDYGFGVGVRCQRMQYALAYDGENQREGSP